MARIATRLQQHACDASEEYRRFCQAGESEEGAIGMFVGQVRSKNDQDDILGLSIEHYEPMTEKLLARFGEAIATQFSLTLLTTLHRVGQLSAHETIVIVLTAAAHRAQAFQANQAIVEQLKTEIPFWKKEITTRGSSWVKPPASD